MRGWGGKWEGREGEAGVMHSAPLERGDIRLD